MLCGIYKNSKQASLILILHQDDKRKRDFERSSLLGHRWQELLSHNAQLASVSIGTVTKVTSAFKSMGKTSVNRVGNCGRQHTFDERDARALVRSVML